MFNRITKATPARPAKPTVYQAAKVRVKEKEKAEKAEKPQGNQPTMTLTVKQLAHELNMSMPTAYDLVKEDGFPSIRRGRKYLVNREALQAWLNAECKKPKAG